MNYLKKVNEELITTDLAKALQLVKKALRTQIFFKFKEVLEDQQLSEAWLTVNGRLAGQSLCQRFLAYHFLTG